jgi:ribosomal protein S27E
VGLASEKTQRRNTYEGFLRPAVCVSFEAMAMKCSNCGAVLSRKEFGGKRVSVLPQLQYTCPKCGQTFPPLGKARVMVASMVLIAVVFSVYSVIVIIAGPATGNTTTRAYERYLLNILLWLNAASWLLSLMRLQEKK